MSFKHLAWLITLLSVCVAIAAVVGSYIYVSNHRNGPAQGAPVPIASNRAVVPDQTDGAHEAAADPAPTTAAPIHPTFDNAAALLPTYSFGGAAKSLNPSAEASPEENVVGDPLADGSPKHIPLNLQSVPNANPKGAANPATAKLDSLKPAANLNAAANPPLVQPRKTASGHEQGGPAIGLPAMAQSRSSKGSQAAGVPLPSGGLGLDAHGGAPKGRTIGESPQGSGLSITAPALRKKVIATGNAVSNAAASGPGLAFGATSKKLAAKAGSHDFVTRDASIPGAPGSLDMPPSDPKPGTSDLSYQPASDNGYAYPPGAVANAPSYGPPSTDPIRPLSLIPQWSAPAPIQPTYPSSYSAGIGYQERPKDSIRPLTLAPQLFPSLGYSPQLPSLPQTIQQGAGQPSNSQLGAAPGSGNSGAGNPGSSSSGPSLRVYGVP